MTLEPPCTKISLARQTGLRDLDHPEGYDLEDSQTLFGTVIGLMCAFLAYCEVLVVTDFLVEQLPYGHMRATCF